MRLRPQIELLLGDKARGRIATLYIAVRSIGGGEIAGAPAPGLIDHVDRVALANEILRPALATVRGAGEIGARHGAAMHHDDRIGHGFLRRNTNLDIHLAADVFAIVDHVWLAVDVEEAVTGKHQRMFVGDSGAGYQYRNDQCDSGASQRRAYRQTRSPMLPHGLIFLPRRVLS